MKQKTPLSGVFCFMESFYDFFPSLRAGIPARQSGDKVVK